MPNRLSLACLFIGILLVGTAPPGALASDDIKDRLAAAGDVEKYNADAVVVLDATDVTVRPNGIGTARRHQVVKILRDPAIRSQAVQVFPFDPNTNRLDLVAVRVHRADGAVVEVPIKDLCLQPQAAGSIFWGTKQYLVPLPRLAIGDAVETISDMTGFNVAYLADNVPEEPNYYGEALKPPVSGHWHDEADFWSNGLPIIEKRYTVRMPKDKPLQYGVYNGELQTTVTLDGDHLVYEFVKQDITPLKGESHMEPWPNVAPKLLLATLPTWEDKSRWLYQVSEPQFEPDDAIRKKVFEIIAGLKTDEEKYTALNHWVAENVRYAGTTRGMCEGYTIHDIKETFHDRCGVCKDKAGMLVGMLRVAGYDSFLVMTMARQRVDPTPADQFNHAVTCIRWPDGSLTLLDPTWMPKCRDNWSTLEPLQHVVYGLPEGKELSQSRYYAPEESQATWRGTSTFDRDGNLSGALDFSACGAPEGRLRRTLSGLHPDDRLAWFDDAFQHLAPNARPANVSFMDPVDFSGPFEIRCEYAADEFALGNDTQRILKLPMMQTVFGNRTLYDLFGDTDSDTRQYGIKLLATRLADIEETVTLPAGWTVADLPEAVDLDGPAAALHFEITARGNKIQYACKLTVKRWLIPPDEYSNFKEVIQKFEELTGPVITCELEGARAQR